MSLFQLKTLSSDLYNSRMSRVVGLNFRENPGLRFGLELEVENASNVNYPENFNVFWTTHEDGSLRNNGIEYVTRGQGINKEELAKALDVLEELIKRNPQFQFTERTSFHTHLNFTDKKVSEFHKFLTLYYMLENLLTLRAAFEPRVANHFCLRAQDANVIRQAVLQTFTGSFSNMFTLEKYLGLNLNSFTRFGTLEVRVHRGTDNVNEYRQFLEALEEIYTNSMLLTEPREIFQGMSSSGFVEFFNDFVPITMKYLRSDPQKLIDERMILKELNAAMLFCQGLANVVQIVEPQKKAAPKTRIIHDDEVGFTLDTWNTLPRSQPVNVTLREGLPRATRLRATI